MRPLLTTAIAALLLTGGLTSCAENEPQPKMPPTTSATSDPTQEQTEEPEMPEAFVERWLAALNELNSTGDGDAVRSLSDNCDACDSVINQFESLYDGGGSTSGGGITTSSVREVKCNTARQPNTCVVAKVEIEAGRSKPAEGASTRIPGGRYLFDITVSRVANQWRVIDYYVAPRAE